MSCISIAGIGAVSPAGWGMTALRDALSRGEPVATTSLVRPGWETPLCARTVPAPASPLTSLARPRLRRVSPVTRYAVAAALEALAGDSPGDAGAAHGTGLGLILCVMSGCVNYSRRFYDEALNDPATASPLLFPETVFNAPSSHLAALLGSTGLNYTLVGDSGVFLQGLALGAHWVAGAQVDACVIVGAEEMDWTTGDGFRMFSRELIASEGAGAVCLRREHNGGLQLERVSSSHLYLRTQSRAMAAQKMSAELSSDHPGELLCDGTQGIARLDADEQTVWRDWRGPRLSPKTILGEALTASAAWQCVAAVDALQRGAVAAATVSVVGCSQEAIGARFVRIH